MESSEASSLDFSVVYQRLVWYVQRRINNGEFSERALARQLCVSQPQLHNVLKGVRRLQPAFADQVLKHFGITPLALITDEEITAELACRKEGGTTGAGAAQVGGKVSASFGQVSLRSGAAPLRKGVGSESAPSRKPSHSGIDSKLKPGA